MLAQYPKAYSKGRRKSLHSRRPTQFPVYVRGNVGVVPAKCFGILEPRYLPSVLYEPKPGVHGSLQYSVKVSVTNKSGTIV